MEKLKTDVAVFASRDDITREIATFWNKTSEAFRMTWGPHIHHGYFEGQNETPLEAQEKLIEKLLELLKISPNDRILDAGCGMGGSSLYLAKKYDAAVTGISLSRRQVEMATDAAEKMGIKNVNFMVEDALALTSFSDNEFDIVWSLESCEQFYDKNVFLQQALRVLKPGGCLMLATWCSSADEYVGRNAEKYKRLCEAFQLPYMPTISFYSESLQQQGFIVSRVLNWSASVAQSWKTGLAGLKAHSFFKIFVVSGWRGLLFMKNAILMQHGFDEGRVEYGVFIANKPEISANYMIKLVGMTGFEPATPSPPVGI